MHILIVGINFHPELTGIGKYTGEMAAWLQAKGHKVTVITAPPYYPKWKLQAGYAKWKYQMEDWNGIQVIRCPIWVPRKPSGLKRVLHLASFAASSLLALLGQIQQKPDLVFCVAPAITSAVPVLFFVRLTNAKSWLHIQDFEVDAALDLGVLSNNKVIKIFALGCERVILTRFVQVSTISKRMVVRLKKKGVAAEKAYLFPNWVDTTKIYPLGEIYNPLRAELNIPESKTIVLYSGNMGQKQGIEILIETAKRMQNQENIIFVLCGEGAVRSDIEQSAAKLPNVFFRSLQPIEKLNELLNLADIHVLPQRAGAADLVMPSKLTGMLASGKVVIAMADDGTELSEVVNQVGVVIPPENVLALRDAILHLSEDKLLRKELGSQGRKFVVQNWDRHHVLNGLQIEINSVIRGEN